MESSPSSNHSITDKPDELASSPDVHQNEPHGSSVFDLQQIAQQQLQQPQHQQPQPQHPEPNRPQQKKCSHHRMFDANNAGNVMNERAAFTNAVLQRVNQMQAPAQIFQQQSPFSVMQNEILLLQQQQRQQQQQQQQQPQQQRQQSYQFQQQQQQQPQQLYPAYRLPTQSSVANNSTTNIVNNNGANNTSNQSTGAPSSNTTNNVIHAQNGLVQQVALIADQYLIMDLVEGSTLYKCFDVKLCEELVCKIANNPCPTLLSAHFRLDGHPHVNPLNRVIQGSSQTYLFFKPSQGDLHSYVRVRKRLREPEAKRLFRQMCEVVKRCHEEGIVLRDLKLRKFVFADEERTHLRLESLEDAVVLDNPNDDLLQDKRGCPAYVSPEILKANTLYSGKAADMWSLGVILYTMLVGRYPFNDSEHASLFAKISRGQFLVPDCLTSKARCMIRSLLRKEPEERILSEDILLHPWMNMDENRDRDLNKTTNDQMVPDLGEDF